MKEKTGVVRTFMDIVQVSSATFHEQEMARDVYKRLIQIGLDPQIDKEGNVIAYFAGDSSKEPYVINAHLDTVQDPDGPPVVPHIDDDGWIRSDGNTILGADNKTSVAAILVTLDQLQTEKSSRHHPLEIVFTVSEESGNHGAHGLDYGKLKSKNGFCFDAGEREFGSMIIASPFYNRFDLEVTGKAAHASRPEMANNVLPIVARALLGSPLGRISPDTTANIGIISVGKIGGPVNTIPGEIVVSGEVRSMLESELETVTDDIQKIFTEESEKAAAKMKFRRVRENDGFEFSPSDPFIQGALLVLRNMEILNPPLVRSWGCYEANIFAAHHITLLNIADGSMDNHANTERIRVTDLERLQNLVYKLVTT